MSGIYDEDGVDLAQPANPKPWSKHPRLPRGQVRVIRNSANGARRLPVPAALARMVSEDAVFRVELVEEGILFRYVSGQEPVELPDWMTGR